MPVELDVESINGLREASPDEFGPLGALTGEAFAEDPYNLWMLRRVEVMSLVYTAMAKDVYLQSGQCYFAVDESGRNVGATMWSLSGEMGDLGLTTKVSLAFKVLGRLGPAAVYRMLKFEHVAASHKPAGDYLYLFSIGVLKSARGTGLGRKLMVPMLEQCDRLNLPVYLESSNPDNHGYYASLGFRTQAIFYLTKDAPPMETMLREPRPLQD